MTCFVALTLAFVFGFNFPPARVYIKRDAIITIREMIPPDRNRPTAKALVRVSNGERFDVIERPTEILRAPCAAPE